MEILKPGSGKFNICLCNMSTKEVVVSKKTVIGDLVASNAIPVMLDSKPNINDIKVQIRQILAEISNVYDNTMEMRDKIDLSGIQQWNPEEQQEAKGLITECACSFFMHDMDLGKTSLLNYSIKLTNYTPFKVSEDSSEHVWGSLRTPIRNRVIRPLHSP